jgi:hypothetical protein
MCFVRRWLVAVVKVWHERGCTTGHMESFGVLVKSHRDFKANGSGKKVNKIDAVFLCECWCREMPPIVRDRCPLYIPTTHEATKLRSRNTKLLQTTLVELVEVKRG